MRPVTRQNISGTSWPSTVTQYSMTRTGTVTPSPDSSARQEPSGKMAEVMRNGISLLRRISTCADRIIRAIRAAPW
jgi:hypothetical protein